MKNIETYKAAFLKNLKGKYNQNSPQNLYEPIEYILNLGGKRIRPILVLISADLFAGKADEAMNAALAVEIFHNFSLVHDDIMDAAPLRRGQSTVHEKWDTNTGILSGDAMLITAYQLFEAYPVAQFKPLAQLFSKTALEVCEGQQYDIDFETQTDVEIDAYLKMIEYKTAVLVGAALQMGAIVAGATEEQQAYIYEFGRLLGIAFQIKDDYLDVFGDSAEFGKQLGGDIIENKKTYLYLKALEGDKQGQLQHLFSITPEDPAAKIESVKRIYDISGAADFTLQEIKKYTHQAFESLDKLDLSADRKAYLKDFGLNLMNRTF
ncbi:MAG: polyprenyl synthetase family protein [Psychroflexus sp.]